MSVFISGMTFSNYDRFIKYIQNNIPEVDLITLPELKPSLLRDYDLTQIDYIFIIRDIRVTCLYYYLYKSIMKPFIDIDDTMNEYLMDQIDSDGIPSLLLKENTFKSKNVVKFEQLMTPTGIQQLANLLGVPANSFSGIPQKFRKYDYWVTYEEKYDLGQWVEPEYYQKSLEVCSSYQNFLDLYTYTTTTPTSGDLIW